MNDKLFTIGGSDVSSDWVMDRTDLPQIPDRCPMCGYDRVSVSHHVLADVAVAQCQISELGRNLKRRNCDAEAVEL